MKISDVKTSDVGATSDAKITTLSKRKAKETPAFTYEGSTAEDSPCDELLDKLEVAQTSMRSGSSSPKRKPEQHHPQS